MLKEILLVDDDTASLVIGARLVRNENLALNSTKCFQGREALEYLMALLGQGRELPELILLDLNMPVMNGWDFMDEFTLLRSQMDAIPKVIILSSSPDPADVVKAKTYPDILEFISKPLSAAILKRLKETYFPLSFGPL